MPFKLIFTIKLTTPAENAECISALMNEYDDDPKISVVIVNVEVEKEEP